MLEADRLAAQEAKEKGGGGHELAKLNSRGFITFPKYHRVPELIINVPK